LRVTIGTQLTERRTVVSGKIMVIGAGTY